VVARESHHHRRSTGTIDRRQGKGRTTVVAKTIRVLIGYASRFGSTRDIANRIADAVRKDGSDVDVRSVDGISDLDHYDAVVFGSGVSDGSWTAEATELMRRHAVVLAHEPVWLFSVGSFGDRHPIVGGLIKKEPKEISEFEHTLHPRDDRVFAGVIDLDHWPAWGRLLFKPSAGTRGTTASGPTSMRGPRGSRRRFDRRTDRPIIDLPPPHQVIAKGADEGMGRPAA
jgi:menaquinone-dependent protoporphyrinogen oxidase